MHVLRETLACGAQVHVNPAIPVPDWVKAHALGYAEAFFTWPQIYNYWDNYRWSSETNRADFLLRGFPQQGRRLAAHLALARPPAREQAERVCGGRRRAQPRPRRLDREAGEQTAVAIVALALGSDAFLWCHAGADVAAAAPGVPGRTRAQEAFVRGQVSDKRQSSKFWRLVGLVLTQFDGLVEGYQRNAPPGESLTWQDLYLLQSVRHALGYLTLSLRTAMRCCWRLMDVPSHLRQGTAIVTCAST